MALRVSRLVEELTDRWDVILLTPAGSMTARAAGARVAAESHLPRTGQWMYLPSQYDVKPVVSTVAGAIRDYQPDAALLWGGMEYLKNKIPAMPKVVGDRVDCMTLTAWRQLLHSRGWKESRRRASDLASAARYEFEVRGSCAATVVVGESDALALRRFIGARNVRVVPNGVDLPPGISVDRSPQPIVVFTGVLSYQPNIDAVVHFVDDIWPSVRARVPIAVFQIVGRAPVPEVSSLAGRPGVEVHADVESVHKFLARAWMSVAPMRSGAGLKNKILESWSVGTPAAMTPIATNGLGSAPADLLLAAENNELAALIGDLLLDTTRRESLGALARTTAREMFSWRSKADTLDSILRDYALRPLAKSTAANTDRS
jgi:glycosyltransferase involved in cell wall biosynthesis